MTTDNEFDADDTFTFIVRNPETGELEDLDIRGGDGQPVNGCSSDADIDRAIDIFLRKVAASAAARTTESAEDDDVPGRFRSRHLQ